ncbi:unnamed protein product [Discosporangium mesarthrocarpum]
MTCLPKVYPTYVWSEEDLSMMEGSPVIAATESMRRKLAMEYERLENELFNKHPEVFDREAFSFASFQWAFAMLFSR